MAKQTGHARRVGRSLRSLPVENHAGAGARAGKLPSRRWGWPGASVEGPPTGPQKIFFCAKESHAPGKACYVAFC